MNVQTDSVVLPRWRDELTAYWKDDGPRFMHIAKVAVAVTLAMGLCMRLELRAPGTAMVSCVIVMMHQQSGMVIARGFYRGLGMVCGSFAGLVIVALFPQQPLLFFLALATWIGVCVFGASYYRNFQSYGFVLTGYGTAITAMPAWSNPYGVFDNVVFTVSEVVIGVISACLVSALVFPRRVTPALLAAGSKNFSELLEALHTMLGRAPASAGLKPFVDLISERAGIESLRSGALFEDPSIRLQHPVLLALDRSFLDMVAWIHALHQLKARASADAHPRAVAAVDELIDALLAIVPDPVQPQIVTLDQVQALCSRLAAFEHALPARLSGTLASLADLSPHQRQFVATTGAALFFSIADLRVLCSSYLQIRTTDGRPWPQSVIQALGRFGRTRATANRVAALIAGVRAAAAVSVVAAAWLASGWLGGSSAIVAVAITSSLFALVPNPTVASRQIFVGCLLGWAAGFAFNFLVLPHFDTFELLALSIAIFVMVGSYLNTFPKTAILGLGFSLYFCFIVNISNPTVYNPSAYLDTGFALLVGIGTAAVAFSVIVPRAGDWITAQYLKQIRALVATGARDGALDDLLFTFELNLRDFIIEIASAPTDARVDRSRLIGWAFAALEIGRAMIQVRLDTAELGETLPAKWPAVQQAWLTATANVFAQCSPQAADAALAATVEALEALPLVPNITVDAAMLTRCRMRALLHITELTLQDGTLSFWHNVGKPA
ncbi:FUSC family protein [Paraburkholderia caledonica]|uniref:Membrane protein YccC n=1 Tax=Paraburkholderia caledonica TaxID=134536 RepID=A0ABU1L4V2_9BURK|nr:FUSC family protein [Paraburkholderia caledonica]MDR6378242.1 putative membrane protein YccC [Paraburkholderia caledonica]